MLIGQKLKQIQSQTFDNHEIDKINLTADNNFNFVR